MLWHECVSSVLVNKWSVLCLKVGRSTSSSLRTTIRTPEGVEPGNLKMLLNQFKAYVYPTILPGLDSRLSNNNSSLSFACRLVVRIRLRPLSFSLSSSASYLHLRMQAIATYSCAGIHGIHYCSPSYVSEAKALLITYFAVIRNYFWPPFLLHHIIFIEQDPKTHCVRKEVW